MSDKIKGRSDDQMKCVYMGPPMRKNPFAALKEKFAGKGPEKKPYPKSFADDRDPDSDPGMVDVYAGLGPEEPELEEVHMGPPLTDEPEEMPGKEPVPEKAAEAAREYQRLKDALAQAYADWEEAEEALSEAGD